MYVKGGELKYQIENKNFVRKHVTEQLSGKWRTGAVSKALHHRNKRMQPIASSQQGNATNHIIATRECNQSHQGV